MERFIKVDADRCVKCGLCARICPLDVLEAGSGGPESVSDHCIACGHCVAVCPQAALDNTLAPLEFQVPRNNALDIGEAQAVEFMRSRRSIRWFKDKPVSDKDIKKLLNVARYAMSGTNTQGVSYYVIRDKAVLEKISAICSDYMIIKAEMQNAKALALAKRRFQNKKRDKILLGAPCLIFTMYEDKNSYRFRDSSVMAIVYAQLFAPVIGLGTCWAGLVEMTVREEYPPMRELLGTLNVPSGLSPSGATMVGYPNYTYSRLVERNELQITWKN